MFWSEWIAKNSGLWPLVKTKYIYQPSWKTLHSLLGKPGITQRNMDNKFNQLLTVSEEECKGEISDHSDEDQTDSLKNAGGWGSLPDVCLRYIFRFLADKDRCSAELACQHWHHVMRSPSLWRSRFFHFNGRLTKYRLSEYSSAVAYAKSLGSYLWTMEVCVIPPRKSLVARRMEQAMTGLLVELTR